MACMPLSEFEGEKESGYNRIMRWRDKYYRSEQALSVVKAQRDELLEVVKYTRQVLPQDIWANDLKVMLDTAIANAEKHGLDAAEKP